MPTHYVGTPDQVRALNTFIKLTRAADTFMARVSCYSTLEDLTISQFGVLESVFHLGPMSQKDIGRKLLKSGGNMTLVIDNLVKRGLVERTRADYDRRVMLISLTPDGRAMIERIFPRHVQAITQEMSVLTPEEQDTLAALLKKLGLSDQET
ncbi:MAG: MarR family transcriptional regulator [Caldilineaceae bacterium]|nr:MarR family transcriptional regulator [Caldilineaceae bacterium]